MFQQDPRAVADSLTLSALCALIPLIVLFVMLGGLKIRAWVSGLVSLLVAIVVAVVLFGMPVGQSLSAAVDGGLFGFFPILWIVINAVWIYNLTVASGHFDVLRRSFEKVSPDQRIQAIIIAFCFGALLEALAGFGTPVAISRGHADVARLQAGQGGHRRAGGQHRAGRLRCAGHPDRHARPDRRPASATTPGSPTPTRCTPWARWSAGRPRSWP